MSLETRLSEAEKRAGTLRLDNLTDLTNAMWNLSRLTPDELSTLRSLALKAAVVKPPFDYEKFRRSFEAYARESFRPRGGEDHES